MELCVTQRGGRIATVHQRVHQLHGGARADYIFTGKPSSPLQGRSPVTALLRRTAEPFKCRRSQRGKMLALRGRPFLELTGAGKKKSVEKWTAIKVERFSVVAGRDQPFESPDVSLDDLRV
jgi:hypothetical protein